MASGNEPTVGWAEIDAHHADLLRRAREIQGLVRSRDEDRAVEALDAMLEATVLHFAFEEALMERSHYPERLRHKGAHDLFLNDLHALANEMSESGLTAEVDSWAIERMPEWLSFHIQTNDLPLARHLLRGRVSAPAAAKRTDPPS